MNVLVTGAAGFIGRHVVEALARRGGTTVLAFDVHDAPEALERHLAQADAVFHLADVNRPQDPAEYEAGNAGLTRRVCDHLRSLGRAPLVVLASSTQAALDNPYGRSKRAAEETVARFSTEAGARVRIYRFQNVFGKWCRPNYNSVVATFCHNIASGFPVQIADADRVLDLVYVDDVVASLLSVLDEANGGGWEFREIAPAYRICVGDLASTLQSFRASRSNLLLPDLGDRLTRCLYATYLSYLPGGDFRYPLTIRSDARGSLAEFVKSGHSGQIFVSRTRPGVTRGNHYHHTKVEKFLVLEGEAVVRFRQIHADEVIEHHVRGEDYIVLDIPPGYTHSIENVGERELVTLFWASEVFDPATPDTVALRVRE